MQTRDQVTFTLNVISTLTKALEIRDPHTWGHSQRVAEYAVALGKTVEMMQEKLDELYISGLLHDIGKIGIPDSVLYKSGSLNENEFAILKRNPVYGYELTSNLEFLRPIAKIIRHAYENYDGSGYPDGLKGEEIPLESRMISIANVYDALTTSRPYRQGLTSEKVLDMFKDDISTHFDPDIVASFVAGMERGIIKDIRDMYKSPVRVVHSVIEEVRNV